MKKTAARRPRPSVEGTQQLVPVEPDYVSNPYMRLDILLKRLVQRATDQFLTPRVRVDLWPHVEPVVDEKIRELGIPARPLTSVDVARRLGILKAPRRRKLA